MTKMEAFEEEIRLLCEAYQAKLWTCGCCGGVTAFIEGEILGGFEQVEIDEESGHASII